jgi:hypothetical protein
MRDPQRIQKILALVTKVWYKYPDLRLTQLIGNACKTNDPYYVEDDILFENLKKVYKEE